MAPHVAVKGDLADGVSATMAERSGTRDLGTKQTIPQQMVQAYLLSPLGLTL
ncbi:hypothetical protein PTT_10268 [Pyrenophora teres f. teres 0-1]|uniref:Uncharacterized protein n=1 Tax=Pyrenophora teres f. teres (strain 0-1) TaxID=861557 RepID=E3RNV2_PYRTT|nr:hypothetical protein PTT_10268 [Pyrenophora teres f. teres 0-1]